MQETGIHLKDREAIGSAGRGRTLTSWITYAGPAMLAALIMGLPTLRGGFVGGDDHRLALNHVLVNRPSLAHAVELFSITHRDLYQPLPLLSFAGEFVVVHALGLAAQGPQAFAWLFHLDNVLLHTLNTALVWAVILRLVRGDQTRRVRERLIAAVAAMIFAVHPFQTEVVAWVNGRMMLLSTLFALLMLLSFAAYSDAACERRRHALRLTCWGLLTVLLAVLCSISKVRIELPILLLILMWARRVRPNGPILTLLAAVGMVTAIFVVINVQATAEAELFQGGAEQLKGPRAVRVLAALAFYFTHFLWPVGLASYYPTPPLVRWSDASTWPAAVIVAGGLVLMAWAGLRSREARLGILWFFASIAAVLPIVPARNILAADRYMYLPMIGLLCPLAVGLFELHENRIQHRSRFVRRGIVPTLVTLLIGTLIGLCWYTGYFYETPLLKTYRIAQLFPDVPRVWERLGWSYQEVGDYDRAIECAKKELRHEAPSVRSGAYQLLGMTALKQGRGGEAIEWLRQAVQTDPKSSLARYRLGTAYDELGELERALEFYESAAADASSHNPTLHKLAAVYRRMNRPEDARKLYEKELENNPFEVPAILALAELDCEQRTPQSLRQSERRLRELLSWMPENSAAWVSLGVTLSSMGQWDQARAAYQQALDAAPDNVTAIVNLAQLLCAAGQLVEAKSLFDRAAALVPASLAQAEAVADFYLDQHDPQRVVALWRRFMAAHPGVTEARGMLTWTMVQAGDLSAAPAALEAAPDKAASSMSAATLALAAFLEGRYDDAFAHIERLIGPGPPDADARRRLLRALERYDTRQPGNPWTYCLTAKLLLTNRQFDAAGVFLKLCEEHCDHDACAARAAAIREALQRS